ncbi:hypothetical protein HAX54_012667 [Datura stramonium]|uniref:Uncharacterized protein n=1 Tax=Datura stramonium TaxID=4076 RepID=A0ABS8TLX5_DATST|nr:hypothetical protein [Datura stramonium]
MQILVVTTELVADDCAGVNLVVKLSISAGSLFLDMPEDNTPRDVPALMGKRASTRAESLAIEATTTTVPSADPILAAPSVTRPPASALAEHLDWNEKHTDLLAKQLKLYVAQSIVVALALVQEAI